jgi:hypothetical protein
MIISLGFDYLILAEAKGHTLKTSRSKYFEYGDKNNLQPVLTELQTWLSELTVQNMHVALRLSSDLAPICLLPWLNEITQSKQQALIAEAYFKKIYGNEAQQWQVSVKSPTFGHAWIASGVAVDLIENINDVLKSFGARVISIAPLTISIFNEIRSHIKASHAWLLIPEFKNFIALYFIEGKWQLIKTLPRSDLKAESLSEILKREARLAGFPEHSFQIYNLGAAPLHPNAIKLSLAWDAPSTIEAEQTIYLIGGIK